MAFYFPARLRPKDIWSTGKMQFGCRVVFPWTIYELSLQSKRNGFVARENEGNNGVRRAFYEFSPRGCKYNIKFYYSFSFLPKLRFVAPLSWWSVVFHIALLISVGSLILQLCSGRMCTSCSCLCFQSPTLLRRRTGKRNKFVPEFTLLIFTCATRTRLDDDDDLKCR